MYYYTHNGGYIKSPIEYAQYTDITEEEYNAHVVAPEEDGDIPADDALAELMEVLA